MPRRAGHRRVKGTSDGFVLPLAKTDTPLRFRWTWPDVDAATLDPAMVIVCREPDGRWYVTFTIDAAAPAPAGNRAAAGVDLGVKDLAATSDEEKIANPRHLQRKARNLARYQRRLARCQQGSANRAKAKAKVARAHRKARNARADFHPCRAGGSSSWPCLPPDGRACGITPGNGGGGRAELNP